ncbi:MAG: hypothetical protein P1V35_10260 [Planctomycetota bacterium]|nr:hypothetical protein [Planctomycetota bacterium]
MLRFLLHTLSVLFLAAIGLSQANVMGVRKALPTQPLGKHLVTADFQGMAPGGHTPWRSTSFQDPSLSYSGWELGPGAVGDAGVDDALAFHISAGSSESTLAEALATGSYATVTLAPAGSGTMDLAGVRARFGVQRLEWHAPRRYALFSSLSGFQPGSELFVSPYLESWDLWQHSWDTFLPLTGYSGLQAPVEFRLYCFAGTYGSKLTSLTGFSMVAGLPTVTLGLTSGSGGSADVAPYSPVYQQGQTVQLSAVAEPGFRFAGWSGSLAGFGNPRSVVLDASMQVHAHFESLPAPHMSVGTNLGSVSDWSSSWVFSDLFRRTRPWMTHEAGGGGPWDTGLAAEIPRDADGMPHSIPFVPAGGGVPQSAHTILVQVNGPGLHHILYEGVGTFSYAITGMPTNQVVSPGPAGSIPVPLPANAHIIFRIVQSDAAPNHLRNIRIVQDSQLATFETEPFHPLFVASLADYDHLRFMDWGHTNGSHVEDWSQRTQPNHFTQSAPSGVALEVQIDLANRTMKDAWFCVPHRASDDYVREMARLIRDNLDPSLRCFVEYSNETWNTMGSFTQSAYVQQEGIRQGLSSNAWDAGQFFATKRSAEIWQIFDGEFGGAARTRTVRVLASHAANLSTTHLRLAALNDPAMNPNNQHADALAIAPYFGTNYGPNQIPPATLQYPNVNDILTVDAPVRIQEAILMASAQKAIADQQGMDLICYEGGQHYVAIQGAENDGSLVQVLHDANRDVRMYDLYRTYLDGLKAASVSNFASFSHCGSWSKWGSWGTLESIDQSVALAHKFRALLDWLAAN